MKLNFAFSFFLAFIYRLSLSDQLFYVLCWDLRFRMRNLYLCYTSRSNLLSLY